MAVVGQPQLQLGQLSSVKGPVERHQEGLEGTQKLKTGEQTIKANKLKIEAAEKEIRLDASVDSFLNSGKSLSEASIGIQKRINEEMSSSMSMIKDLKDSGADPESLSEFGNAVFQPYFGATGVKEGSLKFRGDETDPDTQVLQWEELNAKGNIVIKVQSINKDTGQLIGEEKTLGTKPEEDNLDPTKLVNTEVNRAIRLHQEQDGIADPAGGGIFTAPTDPDQRLQFELIDQEIGKINDTTMTGREILTEARRKVNTEILPEIKDFLGRIPPNIGKFVHKKSGITFVRTENGNFVPASAVQGSLGSQVADIIE